MFFWSKVDTYQEELNLKNNLIFGIQQHENMIRLFYIWCFVLTGPVVKNTEQLRSLTNNQFLSTISNNTTFRNIFSIISSISYKFSRALYTINASRSTSHNLHLNTVVHTSKNQQNINIHIKFKKNLNLKILGRQPSSAKH